MLLNCLNAQQNTKNHSQGWVSERPSRACAVLR
jgi:hypothetical protein